MLLFSLFLYVLHSSSASSTLSFNWLSFGHSTSATCLLSPVDGMQIQTAMRLLLIFGTTRIFFPAIAQSLSFLLNFYKFHFLINPMYLYMTTMRFSIDEKSYIKKGLSILPDKPFLIMLFIILLLIPLASILLPTLRMNSTVYLNKQFHIMK